MKGAKLASFGLHNDVGVLHATSSPTHPDDQWRLVEHQVRAVRGRWLALTVQVEQMITPLLAGMPRRLLEARKALPHPAEPLRKRP